MNPTFPERFNMAHWFLDARIEEGFGDKVAVRCGDRALTYAEVQRMANRVGNALRSLGSGIEDRVLIVLPDCLEFPAAFFGTLKIGSVVTMVNVILPAEDYAYYLDYTRAKVAIVHEMVLDRFLEPARTSPFLRNLLVVGDSGGRYPTFENTVDPQPDALTPADTHKDDVAAWLFTSGTTGKAKGAVHCHHDFPYNTECYGKQVLRMSADDVTVAVPKLFFGYATGTNLMFPFAVGATACLFPERSTPEAVFDAIRRFRPTVLTSVPTMINQMATHPEAGKQDLSCLRVCVSAGEALPPELYHKWKNRFGVEILDGIGSAEMFHIYISNRFGEVRPGSLGRPVPGYEARIVGPDGAEVPDGEIGTLWARGDSAALCYFNRHESSKETLRGDWVVSGDLFRRDVEGFFHIAGRADDLLKVGGVWVSPTEVEDCLLRHEAVAECAVVGRPDADGLVLTKAYVVLRSGPPTPETARTLQEFVKARLAPHKYPRLVEFLDALPRNERGKIERRKLP